MTTIGIDIGGTNIKFFAVDRSGKVLKTHEIKTNTSLTAGAFLAGLAGIVNSWKPCFKNSPVAIGVGLPGVTDRENGVLRWAPNIPWHNLKIGAVLQKLTGVPCFISNDASMAAWGAHAAELKAKYKNLLVITMGTGIGGGIIIDGKPYYGATGTAGEIGHTKIDFSAHAPLCGCGARGCLEAFCGTIGIKRMAVAAVRKNSNSTLAGLMAKENFSVKLLSAAAKKGDKAALGVWHDIGVNLGRGIANIALTINPQAVVLAGGVSRGAEYFRRAMQDVFKEQSVKMPFKKLKILVCRNGNIGGIGAAMYALSKVNEK